MKSIHFVKKESGSVMLEYVILNFMFMVALAVSGLFFVEPNGGTAGQATYEIDPVTGAFVERTEKTQRYGILGSALMKRYDLMLQLVAMPYP